MSNSDLFVVEKDMSVFEFGFLQSPLKPILRSKLGILIGGLNENDGFQIPSSPELKVEDQDEQEPEECAGCQNFEISKTQELQVEQELEEDEKEENGDGFRTPTSFVHKIEGFRDCPPAPKKPKSALKRKPADFRYFPVDSDDLESIFRPILAGFHPNSCQKIKKICVL